jgi:DNA-binding PadR family transcriptional regulator
MSDGLPLTDLAFHILMALTRDELHGYALVKRLQEIEGRASLRTGTVYAALARLRDQGWVAEADRPSDDEDSRRQYYRITAAGLRAARAEAARLNKVLGMARSNDLLGDPALG